MAENRPLVPHSHADLVRAAVRWLRGTRRCGVVLAEMVCATRRPYIPDAIGWPGSHWSILVECKTSRSDFAADRKKLIHALPDNYPGQERWFLTPPGLVTVEELPPGWLLAEVHGNTVRCVTPLNKWGTTPPPGQEFAVINEGRFAAEVPLLLSAVRRHQLGVPFYAASGRFQTIEERNHG